MTETATEKELKHLRAELKRADSEIDRGLKNHRYRIVKLFRQYKETIKASIAAQE